MKTINDANYLRSRIPVTVGSLFLGVALWSAGRSYVLEASRAFTADYLHANEFREMRAKVITHIENGNFVGATFDFSTPGSYMIRFCSQAKLLPTPHATFEIYVPPLERGASYVTNLAISPMSIVEQSRVYITNSGETSYCELLEGGMDVTSLGAHDSRQ